MLPKQQKHSTAQVSRTRYIPVHDVLQNTAAAAAAGDMLQL
jgi:hypothetical protein